MEIWKKLVVVLVSIPPVLARANTPINIPNASFELPETVFVSVDIDSWQKSSKPWWYDESGGYLWIQLTGVFLNVPPTDPDYIDNCDGDQGAWLWAYPEVELFQDVTNTFEVGQSYHLTVGIFGGGLGGMKDGVPIEIRLYCRDAESNKVTVGATTFTYYWDPNHVKHFNDVRLDIPPVSSTEPWADKNIGVQIISTVDPVSGLAGEFWDLDNVRLTKSPAKSDFTGDYLVNFGDFAVMASEWLSCAQTTTDLTGDGCVNVYDLMILAESWLMTMQE